jgi:hypothetical protein
VIVTFFSRQRQTDAKSRFPGGLQYPRSSIKLSHIVHTIRTTPASQPQPSHTCRLGPAAPVSPCRVTACVTTPRQRSWQQATNLGGHSQPQRIADPVPAQGREGSSSRTPRITSILRSLAARQEGWMVLCCVDGTVCTVCTVWI